MNCITCAKSEGIHFNFDKEGRDCQPCHDKRLWRTAVKAAGFPAKWENVNFTFDRQQENVVSSYSKEKNLLIYGPTGCGKSYVAASIFKDHFVHGSRFIMVPSMLMDLRDKFDDKKFSMSTYVKILAHAPILVMDDLGADRASDWALETIYCILNERDMAGIHGLVVTSNLDPENIEKVYGQRISSRILDKARIVTMVGEDLRLKR